MVDVTELSMYEGKMKGFSMFDLRSSLHQVLSEQSTLRTKRLNTNVRIPTSSLNDWNEYQSSSREDSVASCSSIESTNSSILVPQFQ
jgi:hypothetical protein